MQHTVARKVRPIIFAVALAVAGASPALAASTSSTTTESLEVTSSISLSGVPASLAYSSVNAGATASAPEFTASVSSNQASGWTLSVDATDLVSGGNAIAMTQRTYVVSGNFANFTATGGGSSVAYPGGPFVLATRNSGGAADVFLTSRVAVPANAVPGVYTGSAVFTASTN